MPYLNIVHLRALTCAVCGAELASAGARSFIVSGNGEPFSFPADDIPENLLVQLTCANGHVTELSVPGEVSAEEARMTPDDAPIATDAVNVAERRNSLREEQ